MNIGELCTRRVVTASREDTALTAATRMREQHVGDLVVVDRGNHPVGIVTDRDLVLEVMAEGRPPDSVPISEVMTREPITVEEHSDVSQALGKLREHGIRRLPVVAQDGRLLGIIAYDDLVEWIAEELDDVVAMFGRGEGRERGRAR